MFVSRQFREINFVTALRDVGGSGERSSSGGSELPLGNTEPLSEAAGAGQEESREEAGGRVVTGVGKPGPRGGFGPDPQVRRCLLVGDGVRNSVQVFHGWNFG